MQPPPTDPHGSPSEAGCHCGAAADPPADDRSRGRSLRVIVADGDPAMHPFYEQALARLSHQVCVALTGRQLVGQCRLLRPDLVIAGVELADLDGVAAAEEICRERPTPIIIVPGGQDADAVSRALANPYVLACLFKPVKEADLGVAIALSMRRFEQLESLRKEADGVRQALEERKLIERAKGLVMRYAEVDGEDAYRRLQKLASDQNCKLVELAQAILLAGEAIQQLERTTVAGREKYRRTRSTDSGARAGQARRPPAVGKLTLPEPPPVPEDSEAGPET